MAEPCTSQVLMVSVIHGAVSYGVAVAVSYELTVQDIVVRGEGVVGPTCRAIVAKDLVAVCSFLTQPGPQNSDVTEADLVITTTMGNGNAKVTTLKDMTTRGFAFEFNRDSPPALYRQTFVHVGSMSVNDVGDADLTNVAIA